MSVVSDHDHMIETYIRTTPDALWQALTDGTITQQYYYGIAVESTWEVGTSYRYAIPTGSIVEGEILAVEVARLLDTTFRARRSKRSSSVRGRRMPKKTESPER